MNLKENVVKNWAAALTNIAIEQNKVDDFIEQSNALIDALKGKEDFIKILTIKSHHDELAKVKIIDETFSAFGINENILNAMKILVEMKAFSSTRTILKHLRKNLTALHDITYGVIWSTKEISEKQIIDIENKIAKKIGKHVKLVNKIDNKLIGGLQVIVNNQIFDGSVKGQLDAMRYEVLKRK
ncbi:ATP synthase F1 subunit delta [Mesoplasma syrphidae]|uniref:ATP synthase subunit delta n=1 Tax=Mesoplasma syrphidae TaxID=225999 RepID=A0A2K9BS85_9MOLU|nr:F0F1 ATP synthase subunit delta [Mesoplasma syrphidae]AUF83862.1 ATP synthase F1 subunit delta [Mesoplasma syrphidae]